jgi:hypothetical protein
MTYDELMLNRSAEALRHISEVSDSILILTTYTDNDQHKKLVMSHGNLDTLYALAKEFVIITEEKYRNRGESMGQL